MLTWAEVLCWIEKHPGLASWMQAVGAIVALMVAIGVPWWQKSQALKQARDTEKAQLRHLISTLLDEITVASEAFAGESGELLLSSANDTPIDVIIPLLETPFPIYHACLSRLGQLPTEELRKLVIKGYGRAIGFVASIRFNNVLIERLEHAQYLVALSNDPVHNELRDRRVYVLNHYGNALRSSYKAALEDVGAMQAALREWLNRN